jgi:2-methylcitrate dehydratase PrpD
MVPSITNEIVTFLLQKKRIPQSVIQQSLIHVIDGLAVMLAGARRHSSKKLVQTLSEPQYKGESTFIGFSVKGRAADAALINGTSGHADDYDDTQLSTVPDRIYGLLTHPTVPVLASTLALGEHTAASGRDVLNAFIRGFEVECKLAEAIRPQHYQQGFHTTGTIGAFGACAAGSQLLHLEESSLRCAFGITASLSSGIRVNFGTMTKPLHAGMAAFNGVTACLLAQQGFTADQMALDSKWGFMQVLGGGWEPERIIGKLGNPFSLVTPGASIKIYPCGSLGQPTMYALQQIIQEENLHPHEVREVRVRAGPNILAPLRYTHPDNELEAKFSLQFGLACILVRRHARLEDYTSSTVHDPEIRETMLKVKPILDPEISNMGVEKMRSILEIELNNHRVITQFVDSVPGTPEDPLKKHDLQHKFCECAAYTLSEPRVSTVFNMIQNIRTLKEINQLTSLLIPTHKWNSPA